MNKKEELAINTVHIPRWNELPNVDLYLDQVVTFINSALSEVFGLDNAQDKKENQILTKTMINNYVKNNLIDAPVKKKYSRKQCAKIFVICILKQVYSMNDISKLIEIAITQTDIEEAYNSFCNQFEESLNYAFGKKDLIDINYKEDKKYLLKAVLLSCSYKLYVQYYVKD